MNKSLKTSLLCAIVISFALSGCDKPVTQDAVTMDAVPAEVSPDGIKVSDSDRKLAEAKVLFAECKAKGISTLKGDERHACNAASDTVFFQPYKPGKK